MIWRLKDLYVVVVRARQHRRTGVEPEHAALRQPKVFRPVRGGTDEHSCSHGTDPILLGGLLPRGGGYAIGDTPVRGIHDQRCTAIIGQAVAPVPPEVVVGALHIAL